MIRHILFLPQDNSRDNFYYYPQFTDDETGGSTSEGIYHRSGSFRKGICGWVCLTLQDTDLSLNPSLTSGRNNEVVSGKGSLFKKSGAWSYWKMYFAFVHMIFACLKSYMR